MDQFGPEDVGYNLTTHRLIEATKVSSASQVTLAARSSDAQSHQWAYAERATLADPAFVSNVTELEQRHLTQASAAARRAKINDTRTYEPSYCECRCITSEPSVSAHQSSQCRQSFKPQDSH